MFLNIFVESIFCLFTWFSYTTLFTDFPLGQGFSSSQHIDWCFRPDNSLLGMGRGYPVHCRAFSSFPGIYPMDARSTLPPLLPLLQLRQPKHCLQTLPNATWGRKLLLENHYFRQAFSAESGSLASFKMKAGNKFLGGACMSTCTCLPSPGWLGQCSQEPHKQLYS